MDQRDGRMARPLFTPRCLAHQIVFGSSGSKGPAEERKPNPICIFAPSTSPTVTPSPTISLAPTAAYFTHVAISDIQNVTADAGGTCLDSPLDDQAVTITGIVMKTSGSSYYSTHHGFYVQDSDTPFSGIYVYVGTGNVAVTEGDLVEVNGTVYECAALADDDARALSQILRIGGSLSSLSGTGDSRRSHPSPARPC